MIKDGGGRLVTERGAVLKMWEGYFKELLNWEGSNGELELPCYVEGKVDLVEITEEEVQTALKRTKKGRVPDTDEVCTEMIIAAGRSLSQLDEEAVEYIYRVARKLLYP